MSMLNKNLTSRTIERAIPEMLMIKNAHVVDVSEKLDSVKSIIIQKGKIVDILETPPQTFEGEVLENNQSLSQASWWCN